MCYIFYDLHPRVVVFGCDNLVSVHNYNKFRAVSVSIKAVIHSRHLSIVPSVKCRYRPWKDCQKTVFLVSLKNEVNLWRNAVVVHHEVLCAEYPVDLDGRNKLGRLVEVTV